MNERLTGSSTFFIFGFLALVLVAGCSKDDPPWLEEPEPVVLEEPVNIADNKLKLNWSQSEAINFKLYRLYKATHARITRDDTVYFEIPELRTTSYVFDTLSEGVRYYFRVEVENEYGGSAFSNEVSGSLLIWRLSRSVNVGDGPGNLAFIPDTLNTYHALVANSTGGNLSSLTANRADSSFAALEYPWDVAASPAGDRAYVTCMNGERVAVINTASNQEISSIGLQGPPLNIALSPDGTRAYVTSVQDSSLAVINTENNQLMRTIDIGMATYGAAVSPDGGYVYLTALTDDKVLFISTSDYTVETSLTVGGAPRGIAVGKDGKDLYVANNRDGTVSVINTETLAVERAVSVGQQPVDIDIAPDGEFVYVSCYGSGEVYVISAGSFRVNQSVEIGGGPMGVAVSPDSRLVYVTGYDSDAVSVIQVRF